MEKTQEKTQAKTVRQYALRYDRVEILLPTGAEVLSVSALHDRPILFVVADILLTMQEPRIFNVVETGFAFQRTPNLRFIGSFFALQKWFHAFEEVAG